jgi:hypothetical protein
MEITGRITRDAVVTALKDERTVINFNLAVPGGYKDKMAFGWIEPNSCGALTGLTPGRPDC